MKAQPILAGVQIDEVPCWDVGVRPGPGEEVWNQLRVGQTCGDGVVAKVAPGRDGKEPNSHGLGSLLQRSDRVRAEHRRWDGQLSQGAGREQPQGWGSKAAVHLTRQLPSGNCLNWAGDLISRSCLEASVSERVTGAAC